MGIRVLGYCLGRGVGSLFENSMMKRIFLTLIAMALVAVSLCQTNGSQSGISPRKLLALRHFKMRFLVPTYVPAGYKLSEFKIEDSRDPNLLSWTAAYTNAKTKGQFFLQMCSDGIGDIMFSIHDGDTVEGNGETAYASKVFGKGTIESYVKGRERQWHLNWVELISKPKFVSLIGIGMSASEGKRIVEALRWLK